jgi:hypothetical protein
MESKKESHQKQTLSRCQFNAMQCNAMQCNAIPNEREEGKEEL